MQSNDPEQEIILDVISSLTYLCKWGKRNVKGSRKSHRMMYNGTLKHVKKCIKELKVMK